MTARAKALVRRLLAWSSIPAVAPLYRSIYSLLIVLAARVLRQKDGIVALYLSRGCVKQEILPGVSDIDLVLIVSPDALERKRVERRFAGLQTLSAGLIPFHPSFVMTQDELVYRWKSVPFWRYRLQEGKTNWRLLAGSDVRTMLPEMSAIDRKASCAAEMNYWWVQFARFVLHGGDYLHDGVMRNSICYKAVAETLSARRAMRTGEYCYSKEESLRREDSALTRRLLKCARNRHLSHQRDIEEAVYRFLVESLCEVWGRFENDPCLHVYSGVRQSLDSTGSESGDDSAQLVMSRHGAPCAVVSSVFWPVEDRLIVVEAPPSALPTLDELDGLLHMLDEVKPAGRARRHLFLKTGAVGFPLTPEMPRDIHRGVLTAATAPDVFLQLGEDRVFWTSHAEWYLTEWQKNRQWPELCPLKRKQLEAIALGAASGHVVYPFAAAGILKSASV